MLNQKIQAWLVREGKSRADLAAMLHVSPRTVDGWLGNKPRPIPHKMHAVIEEIVAPQSEPDCIAQEIIFSEKEWEFLTADLPPDVDKKEAVKKMFMQVIQAAKYKFDDK